MGQPFSPQILGLFDPTKLTVGMLIEAPYPVVRPPAGKRSSRARVAPMRGVVVSVEVPQFGDIVVHLRAPDESQRVRWGISNFEPTLLCNPHKSVRVLEIEP